MFLLFCLRICCSHYFKQLDNVQKTHDSLTSISAMLCVKFPQVQIYYIDFSEIRQ